MMKNLSFTYIGLLIAYLGIMLTGFLFKTLAANPLNNELTLFRELINFILVGILFWIIIKKEELGLDSIGIQNNNWKQTFIWAVITGLLCLVGLIICLGIIQIVGWEYGNSKQPVVLSLFTISMVMLRAGIAEEVFFRGFILERMQFLFKSKWLAIAFSVIPFALMHYSQGLPGIFISLVLGTILTATYLWKRNLKANMIAHFLIDFVPNVLIPLFMS